jgi:tetratricopeptide (TPR) repeat protein
MAKLTPQRRSELDAEREFLLRSLDDLEAELLDGGIDQETYATLQSDYTARTAIVLRALAGGNDQRPKPAPIPAGKRWLAVVGIVVFMGASVFMLAKSSGTRAPGETLSGNDTADTYDAHMRRAGRFVQGNDVQSALEEYRKAEALEPTRAEVRVELAKLLISQVQAGNTNPSLIEAADAALDRAMELDPTYADAFAFKGVVLARLQGKPQEAAPFLNTYLRIAPNGPYAPMARSVLGSSTATT